MKLGGDFGFGLVCGLWFCFLLFFSFLSFYLRQVFPECPVTHSAEHTGFELRSNVSPSPVLGLKAFSSMPGFVFYFLKSIKNFPFEYLQK